MYFHHVLLGLIVSAGLALPSAAAEITVRSAEMNGRAKGNYHDQIVEFQLTGEIRDGDDTALRNLIATTMPAYYPNALSSVVIYLDSQGGSFSEGVKLMKSFKELAIGTVIAKDAACLSACGIAFLGGTIVNDGSVFQRHRLVEPGARLGFHAPSLGVRGATLVPADLLQVSYASALAALGQLIEASPDFDIPTSLLETIAKTSPEEMYELIFVDDFARWKIDVKLAHQGWKPGRSHIARLCSNFFTWQSGASALDRDMATHLQWQQQLANAVVFVPAASSGQPEFAHVQTLAYDYDEHCIVQMYPANWGWSIGLQITNATPQTAIQALRTSNLGLPHASRLHTLPADLEVRSLR